MVSKVEFETIDTRSLELESSISHMTIIFEVRTIYRLRLELILYDTLVVKKQVKFNILLFDNEVKISKRHLRIFLVEPCQKILE